MAEDAFAHVAVSATGPDQNDRAVNLRIGPAHPCSAALDMAWQALAENASEPNGFAEPWFVQPGLRQFAGGSQVRLLELWSGNRLDGLLPLALESCYGRLRAAHVANWRHPNSFLGTPLVRRGEERRFWREALRALDGSAWAPGFLHLNGLDEDGPVLRGLEAAAADLSRPCPIVHRELRALLVCGSSADGYYVDAVRPKKRKEIGRLRRRLGELGDVRSGTLACADELEAWCDAFLHLEHAGWKGRARSSLASTPQTAAFFREALAGAHAAGRLQFRRMDLDGRPIAMLVNFLTPPGSFSFKTTFDEAYSRFSPGVLIQLDNLELVERPDIAWMDSCAAENHPMIDSLWSDRRSVVRVSVPLRGLHRQLVYRTVRALERGSAGWRARRGGAE